MRPSLSVIFFTVVSGAGYGLLFLLGLMLTVDPQLFSRVEALVVLAAGSVFAAAGLSSSLLHLGQPQRAWRALSQWRSSWLSREGVSSLLSFAPVVALAACLWRGADAAAVRACAIVLAGMAACTVCCTAKIYTSLKTIPAWHNGYVLPGYLLLALLTGAAWFWLLHALARAAPGLGLSASALPSLIAVAALASAMLKFAYWHWIATAPPAASTETATGLGRFGSVRSAEAPHTEQNYLTREMGFVLARKHVAKLRAMAIAGIAALPVAGVALALAWPPAAAIGAAIAALSATVGAFVERWLFFAEARHVVMLYYR